MTIVIQYEYYKLIVRDENFLINLSFNDIRAELEICYDSVISFADPYANFGLKFTNTEINKKNKHVIKKNNVIDFESFKKN